MIALQDHFAQVGPMPVADHASGGAVVEIDGGALRITISAPTITAPPSWMLAGGIWNDAAQWNDAALWEDS